MTRIHEHVATSASVPAELRRTVVREAAVVAGLTGLVVVASVQWDLPRQALEVSRSTGVPVDQIVVVLAASHLLMMIFGARRARQLKAEAAGRAAAERVAQDQARQDPLTGLASLPAFLTTVREDHESTARDGEVAAVLFDVDRFAAVNDTLGHEVGSALLVALASRARGVVPRGAVLARTGGDMFGIFLRGELAAQAGGVAAALRQATTRPLAVGELSIDVDLSIGMAGGYGPTATDLLRRADVARVHAKRTSAGVVVYDPAADPFDAGQLALHADLRRAIRDRSLSVHYQPKFASACSRVTGVEALVRWHHPELGLLGPGRFIGVAEQTALIAPLTDVVLDRALQDCHRWQELGRSLQVAVNVSPRLLQDLDFPGRVAAMLRRHHVEPDELELEITETAALEDERTAMTVLSHLRLLGVRLSVDDFGTGHASLTHLVQLPVSTLKIDRSFVAASLTEPASRAIVRSTIDLAHALDLEVVAEGVESGEQWHQLLQWGCDLGQGYWFSEPVPAGELLARAAELERRCARPTRSLVPRPPSGA